MQNNETYLNTKKCLFEFKSKRKFTICDSNLKLRMERERDGLSWPG